MIIDIPALTEMIDSCDPIECYCVSCEQLVNMEHDSDSLTASTPDGDDVWWDQYDCNNCHQSYDRSGRGGEPSVHDLIAYNRRFSNFNDKVSEV